MPSQNTLTMAQLPYHLGFKVRVYPSTEQKRLIKRNSDASRFIYNEMVALNRELALLRQVKIPIQVVIQRIATIEARLNHPAAGISMIHGWLNHKDFDSDMKANAIKAYHFAWRHFNSTSQAGFPQFHKRRVEQSYQTSNHYRANTIPSMTNGTVRLLDRHHLTIGKIGRLRFAGMPKWLFLHAGNIRIGTTTVSMDATGAYFVSCQLGAAQPFSLPLPKTGSQLGIDLNVKNFLTDSNGTVVANPRYYERMTSKLARAQQILARRARRAQIDSRPLAQSKNYQKQRQLVSRIHRRIANQRNNFLHQVSTTLIKNHDLLVAERLQGKKLSRVGTGMGMRINDVGWHQFLDMLAYKAILYQKQFVTVDPRNTTQTCHRCGFVLGTMGTHKLTLAQRQWTCPRCQYHHLRDVNAPINILSKASDAHFGH